VRAVAADRLVAEAVPEAAGRQEAEAVSGAEGTGGEAQAAARAAEAEAAEAAEAVDALTRQQHT
jgi:hypothetical protein